MDTTIRLLQEWKNGDTVWPEGQLLNISEQDAEQLVKAGIAEIYEPKKGDMLSVSPVGGNMTEEQLEKLIEKHFKTQADNRKKAISVDNDEFAKKAGFVSFAEFARDVYRAYAGRQVSEKLSRWDKYCKSQGLSESVGSDGGYLVPPEFSNTLLSNALEASIVQPRAMVIPMSSNTIKIPIVQDTSHASSVYGGIVIYRPEEGGQKTKSKPRFGQVELTLHKLVGLCYATDELLDDSPISLEPLLTRMFSDAIAWQMDEDFINGTGAGQALGVLNSPCLVTVAKESGQSADTIVTENIVKMWSRMYPRCHGKAVWLANPDTFPQLATLSITVSSGGSVVGLIKEGVAGGAPLTLLGRPLILTEHCQTVGDKGDILLCDFSEYLVAQKAGQALKVDTSIHLRFDYDETAFRFVMRYDGQPWWPAALTPKHGSNTLSPFVALAART